MLEYFSYKKVKKHREEKAAEKQKAKNEQPASGSAPSTFSPQIISTPAKDDDVAVEGTPVLDQEDEKFLERLTSASPGSPDENEDATPPPLPPRVKTPVIDIDSDDDKSSIKSKKEENKDDESKGKEKEKEVNKPKRFTFSLRRKPVLPTRPSEGLHPNTDTDNNTLTVPEVHSETSAMAHLLDDLDLSAKNNRAFSLSSESAEMARRFTQVLRDLVNGVPTAYGDLVNLIEDRDGVLARNYERLPSGLKKLVAQLPEKLTSSLAPELLAVAAEAQGLETAASKEGGGGGLKDAAKKFLTPGNLHDIVTKPGALVGLLKGIVNALKTRFPAFIGTNVLWSLAVFLLLSMLWYCHKRGREVRLEREAEEEKAKVEAEAEGKENDTIDGQARVEELPDDPMLAAPAPAPESSTVRDGVGAREAK
ncbi:hypothetical protein FHL15_005337 [Xylaria flabelliformis]|uniref:Ring-like domain-containing protein n=1 Tax=Xylaria flabelliformis TaxID=2512241 RepID=A0A553I0E4_9PEZI|nr:hypothetical protein FHL15_005337 [Xylaria flabelliformis]